MELYLNEIVGKSFTGKVSIDNSSCYIKFNILLEK